RGDSRSCPVASLRARTPPCSPPRPIMAGGGPPTAAGDQGGFPTMLYEDGLIVVFERQGQWADSMTFTVPQPLPAPTAGAAPAAPGGAIQPPPPRGTTPGGTSPKPPASPAAPRP